MIVRIFRGLDHNYLMLCVMCLYFRLNWIKKTTFLRKFESWKREIPAASQKRQYNINWQHYFDLSKLGTLLATLCGHKDTVMSLKWNVKGNFLLSASLDKVNLPMFCFVSLWRFLIFGGFLLYNCFNYL